MGQLIKMKSHANARNGAPDLSTGQAGIGAYQGVIGA